MNDYAATIFDLVEYETWCKIAENAQEHEENVGTHLDFLVREGAQKMLKEAIEAEVHPPAPPDGTPGYIDGCRQINSHTSASP